MENKYIYCGIELTEREFKKLKECSSLQYCAECNNSSCIIDSVYPRVDSTKYSLDDFIFSLYLLEDF